MTSTSTFAALVEKGVLAIGDGYRAKNDELGFGGPVFLRSAYLQESGWNLDEPECFAPRRLEEFGPKVAQVGDTVITTKGNSLGRLGFVAGVVAGAVYSPHLSYWRSLDHKKIEPRWLFYWALSDLCMPQVRSMAHSTDMAPYLSLRDQLRIEIALPPIAEQRAIAGVLGALDDKIEANRRMNATLEALARALFKSWFVDFDPVRAKMEGRTPALAPDLDALFPARLTDSPLGPIPEGWEVKALSEIAVLSRDTIDPERLGESSVAHFSIPAFDAGQMPVIEAASNIASMKGLVSSERVLFSKLNPEINRVWPITADSNVPMLASTEFLVLAPRAPVSVPWLTLLLTSPQFRSVAGGMTTGTSKSHQRVQPRSLMAIDVICPTPVALTGAETIFRPMLLRCEANRRQSRTLAQLRDLLLPKLLSGALRVRDAEAMIGDAA